MLQPGKMQEVAEQIEERSGKYGSEKLETEGAGEETMERNN